MKDALKGFTQAPFEFTVCKRIQDAWYSNVIDECRAGELREDTYNFLHGYFTHACGSALVGHPSTCECHQAFDEALESLCVNWDPLTVFEEQPCKLSSNVCEHTEEHHS